MLWRMSYVAPGLSHIYSYSGMPTEGWRLRDGWRLDEILSVYFQANDKEYTMVVHVTADPDHTGELAWPPIEAPTGPTPGPV